MAEGIGINLGGSFTSGKQKTSFEQTETGTQKSTGTQAGSQVTSTLDPGTIGILKDVIGTLAGSFTEGSTDAAVIRQLSEQLSQQTDPAQVNEMINASTAEAQRQFGLNQGAQIVQLQQLIGSKGHSFSQLIEQQGNIDLSTALAKIVADIRLGASSQRSTELASALQGYATASQVAQSPLQALLSSIATLTGAKTETQTEESQLMEVLSSLITKGSSVTKSSGSNLGFSLGGK